MRQKLASTESLIIVRPFLTASPEDLQMEKLVSTEKCITAIFYTMEESLIESSDYLDR